MSRTVLFAGGPLHGQVMTVDGHAQTVTAFEAPEISLAHASPFLEPRQVTYNVTRFAMCGRIIWIAHLGAAPNEDRAFQVLTSDAAKAASEVRDGVLY